MPSVVGTVDAIVPCCLVCRNASRSYAVLEMVSIENWAFHLNRRKKELANTGDGKYRRGRIKEMAMSRPDAVIHTNGYHTFPFIDSFPAWNVYVHIMICEVRYKR